LLLMVSALCISSHQVDGWCLSWNRCIYISFGGFVGTAVVAMLPGEPATVESSALSTHNSHHLLVKELQQATKRLIIQDNQLLAEALVMQAPCTAPC